MQESLTGQVVIMAEGDNKSSNMLVSCTVVSVTQYFNDSDLELFSVALLRWYNSDRSLIRSCLGCVQAFVLMRIS